MLAELRKYRVHLVLGHQFLAQLEDELREAILGNVGTVLAFRVGASDARVFAGLLGKEISAEDLIRLPNHHVDARLLVEGRPVPVISAETLRL